MEQAQWKLSVSYFKLEEEALSVQIKMVNNPFEVRKSKDYFKKKGPLTKDDAKYFRDDVGRAREYARRIVLKDTEPEQRD